MSITNCPVCFYSLRIDESDPNILYCREWVSHSLYYKFGPEPTPIYFRVAFFEELTIKYVIEIDYINVQTKFRVYSNISNIFNRNVSEFTSKSISNIDFSNIEKLKQKIEGYLIYT